MEDSHKFYVGIILLFIIIGFYLLNFIRTMSTDADKFTTDTLPMFFILFGAFIIAVGFISFFKTDSSFTILGGSVLSLIALLVGSLFIQNVGDKNNTSILSSLSYFAMIFGLIFLWFKETGVDCATTRSNTSNSALDKGQIKYLGIFMVYAISMLLMYLINPAGIMTKFGGATIFISLFIGLILLVMVAGYTILGKSGLPENFSPTVVILTKGLYIFMSLFISCFLIWWILDAIGVFSNNAGSNWTSMLFNFLILLGVLTLVYKLLFYGGWLQKSAFYSLLVNSIMYIPCLFFGLLDKMRGQKSNSGSPTNPFLGTQKSDVVALLSVLGLISTYFIATQLIVPNIKKWHYLKGGNQVVDEPVAIGKEHTIASFVELNDIDDTDSNTEMKPSYSYGISFWLYVDAFPPSGSSAYSKHSTILDYGGVPLVKYYAATNTLGVYIKEAGTSQKDERLLHAQNNVKLQKWNNVVINYNNGTMDVFYNGTLASSSINVSPPILYDTLTVGMNDGISGNIANVVYYQTALTASSIFSLYNSLKDTSPPTIQKRMSLLSLIQSTM